MKKIGILTSTPSFVSNYGAILQAYALQTQLKKIGCLPQIIKYADDNEYIKGRMPLKQRIMSSIFSKNLSLYAKRKLIINKILNRSVIPKFKEFQINNIDFYNKEYIDYEELKMIANEFYAFIVGSDQVWNPIVHHGVNDPGYFLQFVPSGIKRIAYAPSMGVNKLPKECLDTLHDFLVSFDSISIREETGRKIILDNCGIDVQVVVDPTLLLSQKDYNNIRNVSICPQIPYLVYYKFGRISEIDYIVKKIAKINNYKIVCIPAGLETKFTADYNIGPREFIGLISNADLICTDSFHATVFSIIYNRPFIAFCRDRENKDQPNMNSRITNLLNMLKLNNCWLGTGELIDYYNLPKPNYDIANDLLYKRSEEGKKFLIDSID